MTIIKKLREYIASIRRGQGPHIARYAVVEKLTKIVEEE